MDRKVEKIQITITIDKPTPMPLLNMVEVGRDDKAVVARNDRGTLLMVFTHPGDSPTGYVIDAAQIVKGILDHEEQGQ